MKSTSARWVAFVFLATASDPLLASDFRGFLSGYITFGFALPLSALSLVAFFALAFSGSYRSRSTAVWHARLSSVPPVLGVIATIIDSPTISDEGFRFLANALMLALAQLPYLVHKYRYRP